MNEIKVNKHFDDYSLDHNKNQVLSMFTNRFTRIWWFEWLALTKNRGKKGMLEVGQHGKQNGVKEYITFLIGFYLEW